MTRTTGRSSIPAGTNELRTAASFDFETKSSYSIRVRSTDAGGLAIEQPFTITVNDAPRLQAIADRTVNEGTTLVVNTFASDVDSPVNGLVFSLDSAPVGAAIDPASGQFTWRAEDGPSSQTITVRVTDHGNPPLSATTVVSHHGQQRRAGGGSAVRMGPPIRCGGTGL